MDLIVKALQALVGSQVVADKVQRNEHVIRVLRSLGLNPDHPPADFEGIYAYALVEYGYGKPKVCQEIFRSQEIRNGFRQCFDSNDPQGWLTQGKNYVLQEGLEQEVRSEGYEVQRELLEFANAFIKMAKRSQTPKEILESQKLSRVDRNIKQIAQQVEAIANHPVLTGNGNAAIASGETLALAPSHCRAAELGGRMREWFEVLGYRVEPSERWELDFFEWVINIPVRRGRYDRVLVRGIAGEAGVRDVMALRESVMGQRADEGWLVTARRISQAARVELEKGENEDLMGLTFDELLDQDADFGGYVEWLEREIVDRKVESRYVPLACTKEEFDPVTHQRLGMSRYGEGDGWTEGYIDLWLDDPAKEHLSILGEFGTGKTWLTLHYALSALRSYQEAKQRGAARPRLPIVIPLRDYAKAVSVESLFSEFFFRKHEIPIPGYSAFEQLNRMGKLLLIFDGFDEMAARVDKQQMINNFWELAKVVVPGSKVILTCRTEHFPEAREGRSLLNAELQASTRGLSGETPQFEVLELEKFEDGQIRRVLGFSASEATIEQVMGNPQLLDLARRPVMTELILEALPEIEAGKPVDMSRVYLYAVRRKMERDIKAERTFTSMADKLYFLCELSWEMLSSDRMSLNYREFPDRIRKLFGSAVQEEKDLDHWHYDMMGQTMLIRNSDGDYTPAHRSLLEFFVAFKFAAELGALAPDFLELAQMKSGIDRSLEPRDYTWSEYFGGGAVAPLKGFVTESLEVLRSGFGKEVLSKAVLDLSLSIISSWESNWINNILTSVISSTKRKDFFSVGYLGGNALTLLNKLTYGDLSKNNFAEAILNGADLGDSRLIDIDFSYSDLTDVKLPKIFGAIFTVALNKDKSLMATAGSSCIIDIWKDGYSESCLTLRGHNEWIRALSFSNDGKTLYSASFDQTVRSWDIETGKCTKIFSGHINRVNSVYASLDGKYIISGSDDSTIKIWDVSSGDCLNTLRGHSKEVEAVLITQDSQQVISASSDGKIKIWNLNQGRCSDTLVGHSGRVRSIALNLEEDLLISTGFDQTMKLWNLPERSCIRTFHGHNHPKISSAIFDELNKRIISSCYDQTIKVWDLETGACLRTLEGHSDWVRTIALDKNHKIISGGDDQSIRVWDPETGDCTEILRGITGHIRALAISPNGSELAIGTEDIGIKIWKDIGNESFITKILATQAFRGHDSRINSIQIDNSGKFLITGSFDKTAKIWDLERQTCHHILRGHTSCVNSAIFIPNSDLVATGSADTTIKIWNFNSGLCVATLKGHQDWIWGLGVSADGSTLASGDSHNVIKIWDLATKSCIGDLLGHEASVNAIKFMSNGKQIISASSDKTLRTWDLTSMQLLEIFNGHENYILDVDLSHSGDLIASGGYDNTVKIWNRQTKEILHDLSGHTDGIRSLLFTPDETKVISGSYDGRIKIWDVQTGECLSTRRPATPLARMNITGVKGLTAGTIASLKALGAIEDEEVNENVE